MASATEPERFPLPFPKRRLDRRAVEVVQRLQGAGFETYMVGGCVRDLLLGRRPKDFDLATAARPEAVRRLFRRSRIIGRRFRLVHVYQGREVYEVATFRRTPRPGAQDREGVIRDDNAFGSARQDALRRDFTVNALFLDPSRDRILDWAGGMADLRARRLHSIGPAVQRFREDPVRILRLIKFMRRLAFQPGEEELRAARELAPQLAAAAPPRLVEEVLRLTNTGDMEGVLLDLEALGVLPLLLPDLATWLHDRPDRRERLLQRLARLDAWVREGATPDHSVGLAFLYGPMIEEELDPATRSLALRESSQVPAWFFGRLQRRARLPRTILNRASRLLRAQLRLDPPSSYPIRKRPELDQHLLAQEWFPDALEFLRCRLEAEGRDLEPYDRWHERSLSPSGDED